MKHLLLAALLLVPASAHAQALSGPVRVVDGDTLMMTGTRIRLFGIDAPEAAQTCNRAGEAWSCGRDATSVLKALVAGKQVNCTRHDRDDYGRTVATCMVGPVDLAAEMAGAGYAVAYLDYSDSYLHYEARAKALEIGIWSSQFDEPAAWRAANRATEPVWQATPNSPGGASGAGTAVAGASAPAAAYYRGCDEVRAAGKAPIRRGEPGFRAAMDGDGDGVACEPVRGQG